jgi:hypothetical protein
VCKSNQTHIDFVLCHQDSTLCPRQLSTQVVYFGLGNKKCLVYVIRMVRSERTKTDNTSPASGPVHGAAGNRGMDELCNRCMMHSRNWRPRVTA